MKIFIDAMGGDFAPRYPAEGALLALKTLPENVEVALVGVKEKVEEVLSGKKHDRLHVIHTEEVITSSSSVSELKTKPNSSMVKGLMMSKEENGAFLSAGNTGAQMAGSVMIMGRVEGVVRPTIGTFFPNINGGKTLVIDAGANVDCKPQVLVQIAQMAGIYLKNIHDVENPIVGLLNIGVEDSKGNEAVKMTYTALQEAHKENKLNFHGNIEGRELMFDVVNIALCDGFVGNLLLKYGESIPRFISLSIKKVLEKSIKNKTISVDQADSFVRLVQDSVSEFNKDRYGGVPLLGVNGVSIVCHGDSSPLAISRAVHQSVEMIKKKLNYQIKMSWLEHQ